MTEGFLRDFWEAQWKGLSADVQRLSPAPSTAGRSPSSSAYSSSSSSSTPVVAPPPGAAALAAAGVPTLIVQSDDDRVTAAEGARAVAAAFPESALRTVEDADDVMPAEGSSSGTRGGTEEEGGASPALVRCSYVRLGGGWGHNLHASAAGAGPPLNFLQPGYAAAARFLGFAGRPGRSRL